MPIYFLLSIWVFLSVGREPTPQAYFERGALFYNALTSPFRSGMISKRLARSSAAIRDAAPTGADFVLIEVAFRPQKSESWAHADGNEIPSPAHAGGVGLAVRRLAGVLAGRVGQIPAAFSGDGGESPSLARTGRLRNSAGESHNSLGFW